MNSTKGAVTTPVLALNALPIVFTGQGCNVYEFPYSEDKLEQLRGALPKTARCSRDGDSIYAWSHTADLPSAFNEGTPLLVTSAEHPRVFSRMIDAAVERRLEQIDIGRARWRRRRYMNPQKGNLLNKIRGAIFDSRIGIFPSIGVEPFFLRTKREEFVWALIIKIDTALQFDIPVAELTILPMDCRQMYVRAISGELAEKFGTRLLGQISDVAGAVLSLTDVREGVQAQVDAATVTVESSLENLYRYIDAAHTSSAKTLRSAVKLVMDEFNSPKAKHQNVEVFKQRVTGNGTIREIEIQPGVGFKFVDAYQPRPDSEVFQSRQLATPRFCFDYAAKSVDTYPDRGLTQHGPCSQRTFGRAPKVLFIAPAQHKGTTQLFIKKFVGGVTPPPSNKTNSFRTPPFPKGFAAKYRTQPLLVDELYFSLQGDPAEAYREACLSAGKKRTDYDLVVVTIEDRFKQFPSAANPYFITKAFWLSHGVSVQEVTVEKAREWDGSLQYILNNIALQSYAKMGGTPWVLQADDAFSHEVIIGVGQRIVRDKGRLGTTERVVGYTSLFKANGDYLLAACTPAEPWDKYETALTNTIVSAVRDVAKQEGIEPGSEMRLIFHVFKSTGKRENRSIEAALKELSTYRIEHALVHVNNDHSFLIFDRANCSNQNSNVNFLPPRGTVVALGERERLLHLVGPMQYKNRGMSPPIKLTLDRTSTFQDIDYLTGQVFGFSFMSWAGFQPITEPVTIVYSELIAGLTAELRRIPNMNLDMLLTKLADKRWFL